MCSESVGSKGFSSFALSSAKQAAHHQVHRAFADLFTTGGYHGYWPSNYYDVNPRYGQARQLKSTIAEMENAGTLLAKQGLHIVCMSIVHDVSHALHAPLHYA